MRRTTALLAALASVTLTVTLTACGSSSTDTAGTGVEATAPSPGTPSPSAAASSPAGAEVPGAYLSLSDYSAMTAARAGTSLVYFFHAPWCPDCRATEESLRSEGVPAGLTVVKVDFESATELRQRFGVTQQHTFVEVDAAGEATARWTGSRSGTDIATKVA
jgi:thiol-disulfide isomerase/thioredoxin